jgi:hypothetical protein
MPNETLTPSQRYYQGEISARDAAKLERERIRAERMDTGYPKLNKVLLIVGIIWFLPVFILEALTNRRS